MPGRHRPQSPTLATMAMAELEPTPQDADQPFIAHLIELRDRLIRAVIAIGVAFIALAIYPSPSGLYDLLAMPLIEHLPKGATLIATNPISPFMVPVKVTMLAAFMLALPVVLYQVWAFVAPGLYAHEKRLVLPLIVSSTVLFFTGVAFCYFIILPLMLRMTVDFSLWLGFDAGQWRAQEYLSMVPKFLLAMGLSFEMPVVILTIVKIGLLDSKKLIWFRSYFVVINLFICAVVSPSGDPITMFVMAAPLCVLYEACIIIAKFWEWRDRKREAAAKQAGDQA